MKHKKIFSITVLLFAFPFWTVMAQDNGQDGDMAEVTADPNPDGSLESVDSVNQPVEVVLDEGGELTTEPAMEVMEEVATEDTMKTEDAVMMEEPTMEVEEPNMVVEEPEAEEAMVQEAEVTETEIVTEEPELDIPSLEIDFPESGEMKLEFPSDIDTEPDLAMGDDETISVDFPDEEVRTVIRNVADLYDLNVVVPDTLVGSTSIKLRNVTWRQVFEVVLEPLGYTYVEDRNIIKIRGQDELLQEPVDTRVFLINYAVAGQLSGSLAPLIDAAAGGRIQVDTRTNALIITERPSRMNDVQEIIERLDRPNAQVMIESKFLEITDRDQKNIGVNWASLNSYQLSAGPFNREYERVRDAQDMGQFDSTITDNDNFDFTNNSADSSVGTGTTTEDSTEIEDMFSRMIENTTSRTDTAVFNAQSFNVILSALKTTSDAKLVSNPTVVTLDGEEALISIGERFPVPSYTYNDERGSFEVSGFEYEDIGINLKVRPQVNSAGFIRLDIRPEVSSRAGIVNFGGAAGAEIPIIASRRTESQVTLKDGYTLAIGGLIENDISNGVTKVPVLGDLPYLGKLFTSKSKSETVRNLIIFVTAKTLNPDGTSYREIIDPRALHRMGIVESEVPGYEVPDQQLKLMREIENMRMQATGADYELNLEAMRQGLEPKPEPLPEEDEPFQSRAR